LKKKILILGISSFAGYKFAEYLLYKKYKVFGTYNKKKGIFREIRKFKNNLTLIKLDLEKENNNLVKSIEKIKPSFIIDFASICMVNESWSYPEKYMKINFLSKIQMVKKIEKFNFLKKYIYISTPEVFGDTEKNLDENRNVFLPSTPYATSKMIMESILNNYNLKNNKFIIARFSNFYGPGQPIHRLLPKIIICIKKNIKFPLHGKGSSKRNYIYSDDFCHGILKIINKGKLGKTYHFSSNEMYSVKEIINKVCDIMQVNFDDIVEIKKDRLGKDKIYKLYSKNTRKELNWTTQYSIDFGIKKVIEYVNNNYKYIKNESMEFAIE